MPTSTPTAVPPTATPTATFTAVPPIATPTATPTQTTQKLFKVLKVTTLADSGAGSLRECVVQAFPRVCVFEVSGRITLASDLLVTQPDLVVAGQTAPSPGVMITNGGFNIQSGDVRIEHLALRSGDGTTGTNPAVRRAVTVQGLVAKNIRLKNLSMTWGVDSNMTTAGPIENVIVQDSIIAEALWHSIHPLGARSNGVLVGEKARGVVFVGNLLASNVDRNIRWKYDTRGEMINNVIYGWGGSSNWNTTNLSDLENKDIGTYLDVIGNVYQPGSQGLNDAYAVYTENTPSGTRLFVSDNIAPKISNVESQYRAGSRIFSGPTAISAASTASSVFAKAGARPWDRNADDLRIIAGVKNKTLALRDKVGTWPTYAKNYRSVTVARDPMTEDELNAALVGFEQR